MDLAAFRRSIDQLPVTIEDVLACHPLAGNPEFLRLVAFLGSTEAYEAAPPAEVIRVADGLFRVGARAATPRERHP